MSTFTGTDVIYNGITMHNVVTREWDQEVTYDESGTDVIHQKFNLTFEGILHTQGLPAAPAWIAPEEGAIGDLTPDDVYEFVARALGQPRGILQVFMGEKLVLQARPAYGIVPIESHDCDNGPKPRNVKIEHVVSDKILRISFSIEVNLALCLAVGYKPQQVINNRWSVIEHMDSNFFITRIIRGKIRLFSSVMGSTHAFKHLVVPALQTGFRRERLEFEELSNGLEATYEITDKQVHTSAPFPATKISGRHIESTGEAGVVSISSINLQIEGPPNADKRQLVQLLFRVADSRLNFLDKANENKQLIQSGAVTDHIGERNLVELSLQLRTIKGPRMKFMNLAKKVFATPLKLESIDGDAYHPGVSPVPELYGYTPYTEGPRNPARAFLRHCVLQSPCEPLDTTESPADQSPGEIEQDEATELYGATVNELEESPGDLMSEEHKEAIYSFYRVSSSYITKRCRVQMPIARKASGQSGTKDTSLIFNLAEPQCEREIHVEAERVGEWPEIPEPVDEYTDGNGELKGRLMEYHDSPMPPVPSIDGQTTIYKIDAYYRYAMNRPPRKDEATKVGALGTTVTEQDESALTREDIYKERLEP